MEPSTSCSNANDGNQRIVMTLLVRDESDVVAATIEHHLAAGVDFIVVTDNGSTDDTVDILLAYQDVGVVELIHESETNYDQDRWVTRMARRAAVEHRADWIINCDADEFFWPKKDELSLTADVLPRALGCVGSEFGGVFVQRSNLVGYSAQQSSWVDNLIVRDKKSMNVSTGRRIAPKCCHRADPEISVSMGNHIAHGPNIGPITDRVPLEVLHVPERSYEQYRRKIENGGASLAANERLSVEAGKHWRDDYDDLLSGRLAEVFRKRQLDPDEICDGLSDGRLIYDTRLRDRLHGLVPQAIVPEALRKVLQHP